jgi:hypothetical protein
MARDWTALVPGLASLCEQEHQQREDLESQLVAEQTSLRHGLKIDGKTSRRLRSVQR